MKTLIIGMGEVGKALAGVLQGHYTELATKDVGAYWPVGSEPKDVDIMHVCIRFSTDFFKIVRAYEERHHPRIINICTTVPVGITEQIGPHAVHSTTRGLHPNLAEGLKKIRKHVGGPMAREVSDYFGFAGVSCYWHTHARTTELLHLLNNVHYGINLMFADEAAKLCRENGVDFFDYLLYTQDNNAGFNALGQRTKCRPVLTPPGGKIGGHCVVSSANLIPPNSRGELIEKLAHYNDPKPG